ncbi:Na+-driven multidrug efflux pump [Chryseobacterium taichungense]|uniref:Na+-driven multidrug efflux pump n=1 Tax=Chryseobacterium taichungense TaxID=295069 RepID=A0A1H7YCE6_9FLAO|nr:MATE family efflux transporter [Chryseobacterium taichungense]SEM43896.1 Na+-driven multidrug efflux pump [Chryseobacterium taichungense]
MSTNNIAKNTAFLYFRMFLILFITLYTSRIVLKNLGASDYGIYSLVGGIVVLFGFLNSAMSSATQRYLSYDIGKGDLINLNKTFSITMTIHIGIGILILILAETIGLWYLNNILSFPVERTKAVNYVYQFSILSFLLNILQVPYNALIIARERMKVYAYVSVIEVLLKLFIVYILIYIKDDKLIIYSILTFTVSLIIRLIYQIYCRRNFIESKYKFIYDKEYFIELISYSGWNLFGNIASVSRNQGNNLILNLFFGTLINAAYGITMQVQSAVNIFISNFQLAVNPQIIKNHSVGNIKESIKLIVISSKLSFVLTLILISPVILNIDFILEVWLIDSPKYTNYLVKWCLICLLIDSISGPLMTGIQATGKIKTYQAVVGSIVFLNLPISYFLLKYKIINTPNLVFYTWFIISIISLFIRLYFMKTVLNFNIKEFLVKHLSKLLVISILSFTLIKLINTYLILDDLFKVTFITTLYLMIMIIIIYFFGTGKDEKVIIKKLLKKIIKK